jgi:hypothetical protein
MRTARPTPLNAGPGMLLANSQRQSSSIIGSPTDDQTAEHDEQGRPVAVAVNFASGGTAGVSPPARAVETMCKQSEVWNHRVS